MGLIICFYINWNIWLLDFHTYKSKITVLHLWSGVFGCLILVKGECSLWCSNPHCLLYLCNYQLISKREPLAMWLLKTCFEVPHSHSRSKTTAGLCLAGHCLNVNTSAFPVGTTNLTAQWASQWARMFACACMCKQWEHVNATGYLYTCVCVFYEMWEVLLHSMHDSRREQADIVRSEMFPLVEIAEKGYRWTHLTYCSQSVTELPWHFEHQLIICFPHKVVGPFKINLVNYFEFWVLGFQHFFVIRQNN